MGTDIKKLQELIATLKKQVEENEANTPSQEKNNELTENITSE